MPSTYSPNLRFELIANGEQANTWGTTTNTNIGTLVGEAIAGLVETDVTAADVTLVARNGASDEARQMMIVVVGTPGVPRSVFCPDGDTKIYIVSNVSDAVVTFATVSGVGVDVPVGASKFVYCDGIGVYEAVTAADTLLLGGSPTLSLEAANKGYVDSEIAALPISGLTPNRALISTAGGSFTTSATTSTEIGYLSGVTSAVQTQLNAKAPATSGAAILYGNGSGGFSNVTVGSGLQFSGGTLASTSAGGSVTTVSVNTANGFAGTVTNPSSTPAISLNTTVSGLIKGSAGSLTQATPGTDYAPATSGSQILAGNGAGGFSNVGIGAGLSYSGGVLSSSVTSGVTSVNGLTGAVTLNYSSVGAPSTGGAGASGTWGINITGNSTSCSGNATTASAPAGGGSFITSSNIGGQSVNYANTSGSANALNAGNNYQMNRLLAGNGSFSAPSIAFTSDGAQDTGFYWGSDGDIRVSNNNYNTAEIAPSGTIYVYPIGGNYALQSSNSIYVGGSVLPSDSRLKENDVPLTGALDTINQLRPVSFDWKADTLKGRQASRSVSDYGFIAQEVDQAIPNIVFDSPVFRKSDNEMDESHLSIEEQLGTHKALDYTKLIPFLTAAIQELNAKVDSLQAEVTTLKG